jgi:hypothetical protein
MCGATVWSIDQYGFYLNGTLEGANNKIRTLQNQGYVGFMLFFMIYGLVSKALKGSKLSILTEFFQLI